MGEETNDDRELRDLMTRYQAADPGALEELVRRISPALARYFGASRSRADAEDLLQDCWLRIHRARHTFRPSEPVMPWIYGIARHTRLDAYRKRRRMEARETLVAAVPEALHRSAPPELPSEEDSFDRMIENLPQSQKEVLILMKVSGMSLEEVARATSSTIGAVKQKVHRAYEALRKSWKQGKA